MYCTVHVTDSCVLVQRVPSTAGPRFANRMLQGEKEKLVRLVNKREKKKLAVRGMATLVPLPQFVVFAELCRLVQYRHEALLLLWQHAIRGTCTVAENVIHSLTAVENGPVAKSMVYKH